MLPLTKVFLAKNTTTLCQCCCKCLETGYQSSDLLSATSYWAESQTSLVSLHVALVTNAQYRMDIWDWWETISFLSKERNKVNIIIQDAMDFLIVSDFEGNNGDELNELNKKTFLERLENVFVLL